MSTIGNSGAFASIYISLFEKMVKQDSSRLTRNTLFLILLHGQNMCVMSANDHSSIISEEALTLYVWVTIALSIATCSPTTTVLNTMQPTMFVQNIVSVSWLVVSTCPKFLPITQV